VHLDGYLSIGAGALLTETSPDDAALAKVKVAPEGTVGAGVRVFLTTRWVAHLTARQYAYLRPATAGGSERTIGTPTEVSLAFGALWGGRAETR
jgi:hypothetical protein